MDIKDIKNKLTIAEVIKHYGLKADKHNAFMQTVSSDFNGSFYLRGKPTQVEKNYNFNYVMPSFALPKDNTFVAPRIH